MMCGTTAPRAAPPRAHRPPRSRSRRRRRPRSTSPRRRGRSRWSVRDDGAHPGPVVAYPIADGQPPVPRAADPSRRVGADLPEVHRSPPSQRVQERAELPVGLVDLGVGIAGADDSRARVERRTCTVQQGAPKCDRPFAVPRGVDPTRRAPRRSRGRSPRAGRARRVPHRSARRRPPAWGAAPARGRAPRARAGVAARGTVSTGATRWASPGSPAGDPRSAKHTAARARWRPPQRRPRAPHDPSPRRSDERRWRDRRPDPPIGMRSRRGGWYGPQCRAGQPGAPARHRRAPRGPPVR